MEARLRRCNCGIHDELHDYCTSDCKCNKEQAPSYIELKELFNNLLLTDPLVRKISDLALSLGYSGHQYNLFLILKLAEANKTIINNTAKMLATSMSLSDATLEIIKDAQKKTSGS